MLWFTNTFAYARSFDESTKRYQGVVAGEYGDLDRIGINGLIVKAEVVDDQLERDKEAAHKRGVAALDTGARGDGEGVTVAIAGNSELPPPEEANPRRFYGSAKLDCLSVGPQASKIALEVISHLSALVGAEVTVTLDIQAKIPDGAPTHVVRTVTENAQQLKFSSHGFERE